jgi:hypothetical protein
MIKRAVITIVAFLVALLVGGYFVKSHIARKTKEAAETAQEERIKESIRAAVAQLAKRTNAVENWDEILSKGNRYRFQPILTVELENLWLTDRPILFAGKIKDIVTKDTQNYLVEIERRLLGSFENMFATNLRLVLQCPKPMIDSFLNDHPDLFKGIGLDNRVAVIASITEIETKTEPGSEDEAKEIKIGKGKCIDILYTGDVQLTHNRSRSADAAKSRRVP